MSTSESQVELGSSQESTAEQGNSSGNPEQGQNTTTNHDPEPMDQDVSNGVQSGNSRPVVVTSTPEPTDEDSEKSEFEPNDQQSFFDLLSSDETSPDEDESTNTKSQYRKKHIWSDNIRKENIIPLEYTGECGIKGLDKDRKYSALECFRLFVDDDLINLMVTETNKNARANFVRYGYHEGFLSGWLDVDFKEMTQFVGLIVFMTFKRLPETTSYWSTERLYFNSVACRVFTQTRFHRILTFWHFGTDGTDGPFAKINPVINRLNENFNKYKEPGGILYVVRSTVFLRNKYIFENQPLGVPKKGTKLLKVMDQDVYTYKLKILNRTGCRREETNRDITNLLESFLDKGRLVIFHNLWISVDLVDKLLKRKCHSIGMIRKNSRGTPKELQSMKIENGELCGYQNPQGVSVLKWQQGKGAPYFGITTCHSLETVPSNNKQSFRFSPPNCSSLPPSPTDEPAEIPKFLRDISLSERIFDGHEKFTINTSPLNEQVKWYQRLACDALANTATINALVLYKKLNKERIKMWDFRDKLFRELVDIKQLPNISSDEEFEEPDLED
ncbi:uncharacterized protein [Euwallacea similis]|uniref:uncharacterized protein isoform X1 n=1 Tax=Euwallacea similis TaxID=1736056 RepID=UPI00344C787D